MGLYSGPTLVKKAARGGIDALKSFFFDNKLLMTGLSSILSYMLYMKFCSNPEAVMQWFDPSKMAAVGIKTSFGNFVVETLESLGFNDIPVISRMVNQLIVLSGLALHYKLLALVDGPRLVIFKILSGLERTCPARVNTSPARRRSFSSKRPRFQRTVSPS